MFDIKDAYCSWVAEEPARGRSPPFSRTFIRTASSELTGFRWVCFSSLFVCVRCARISWPYRLLLSARKSYLIVSYKTFNVERRRRSSYRLQMCVCVCSFGVVMWTASCVSPANTQQSFICLHVVCIRTRTWQNFVYFSYVVSCEVTLDFIPSSLAPYVFRSFFRQWSTKSYELLTRFWAIELNYTVSQKHDALDFWS